MNRNWVFQSKSYYFFVVLIVISFFDPQWCHAQIEMKETGSHFQNFNSLSPSGSANTWVDNQTLPGWYWQCPYPSAVLTYFSDDGTSTFVGKRCYGTKDDSDRAIGGLCKDSNGPYCYGIKLFNSSSKTITNISVGYTGEQWRISSDINEQKIIFNYKITTDPTTSFTSTLSGTWVAVNALSFVSPKTGGSGQNKVLNGNDPTNRIIINDFSIQNIGIPPGSFILLRWSDASDNKGDYGLAIDDVTVKWTVPDNGSGSNFVWTGAYSSDWFDTRNWSNSTIPGADSDVEIASVAKGAVCNENIVIKNLFIRNGGYLTIEPSKTITISGNSTFEGSNCLILKSPNNHLASASFICYGIVSGAGSIKVERYISEYLSDTDGWHFYSSPLNHPAIDDQFKPDTYDDLYTYLESTDTWLNQKSSSNNINNFVNGQGYLVSYKNEATHSISGLPNNSDINFTDLSFTGNRGWHLLGNPFPSGIIWGDDKWGISNISFIAKLLNSGGTYSDLSIGESIPSMNGFFIKVNASNNAITIPKAARIHTIENGWKQSKATVIKKIKLVISSNSNNTYAETKIMLNEKATTGYDLDYDSPYLSGMYGAPLFYSVLSNGQELSTNCVPEASSLNFNFEFTPGLAKEYTLNAEISDDWLSTATFTLEDKKTKLKYKLNNSSSIKFSSDTIDSPDRFKLIIDIVTGIEKENSADSIHIFTKDKHVYVSIPEYISSGQISVYDLSGRQIFSRKLIKGNMDFDLSNTGFYLIQVIFNNKNVARKIFIP